jgi:hypothetical protein
MDHSTQNLDELFRFAIVEMGIGGYIPTDHILEYYNPLTAEKFAEIAYATDAMPSIYGITLEAVSARNIKLVIQNNQFENEPFFRQLVELFVSRFGQNEVTFR